MPPRLTLASRSLLCATLARATRPASTVAKKAPVTRAVKPRAQPILDEYGTERKPLPPLSLGKDKAGAGSGAPDGGRGRWVKLELTSGKTAPL